MSLNIKPDIEARLIALANASGTSIDDFLAQMIARNEQAQPRKLSPEEWVTEFEAWADSFPQTRSTPIPDEALSRENLNPDRV
jgi:hypothetical protein